MNNEHNEPTAERLYATFRVSFPTAARFWVPRRSAYKIGRTNPFSGRRNASGRRLCRTNPPCSRRIEFLVAKLMHPADNSASVVSAKIVTPVEGISNVRQHRTRTGKR